MQHLKVHNLPQNVLLFNTTPTPSHPRPKFLPAQSLAWDKIVNGPLICDQVFFFFEREKEVISREEVEEGHLVKTSTDGPGDEG